MRTTPFPRQDAPGELWHVLTVTFAGVDVALSRRVWRAMAQRSDSLTLRFAFGQAVGAGPPGSPERQRVAAALVSGPARPGPVMALLEKMVADGTLTRDEVNIVEQKLLELVTKTGDWK